ncbi:hypothetical protein BABINDRAFT_160132 [Babjeviella inositovora NRRL Y-12698]|uniref:Uncharacterized protein n=1 Tax=Babjeviella inositovora NRRL Y-12698 TaxID=984486 RepID=A0A1E3QWA2_9ASCO|nr:uncharacterized protein BABINDRAFT_160132 [Babjeviella inositovora NRRL Y-12698]ODQ81901.1 hypothetical protein BABINDRAFT_160132 [Babjeviella inositovora NRRL Y-12698]
MLDPYSYVAPSRVKTLLVPLNGLLHLRFLQIADQLEQFREVRLVDVSPISAAPTTPAAKVAPVNFNPQGYPNGRVCFDVSLTSGDENAGTEMLVFLHDFEPWRKTFVVLGCLDHTDNLTAEAVAAHLAQLKRQHGFAIVHKVCLFNSPQTSGLGPDVLYVLQGGVETVMCDVTKHFLVALTSYAKAYQNITLRSPGSMSNKAITRSFSGSSAIALNKRSSIVSTSSLNLTTSETKRAAARVKGRQHKVLGNFYMLAGRYPDALKEFGDAAATLKLAHDNLWLGSALEGIGICIVLLTFLGAPYGVPSILNLILTKVPKLLGRFADAKEVTPSPTNSPKNSLSLTRTFDSSGLSTPELIYSLAIKALVHFDMSANDHEDYVPQLVYCETILRIVKFMAAVYVGGSLSPSVLDHLVRGGAVAKKPDTGMFSKRDITVLASWVSYGQLKDMEALSQCRVYCALASVYGDLELYRKRGFVLQLLFAKWGASGVSLVIQTSHPGNRQAPLELLSSLALIYSIGDKTPASFGWGTLHKPLLHMALATCVSLSQPSGVISFGSLLLSRYLYAMDTTEQEEVFFLIKQAIHELKEPACEYWDPFMLRNIRVLKHATNLATTKAPNSDSPFYNPFEKQESAEKVLVQDDIAELLITVQNPFKFEIDLTLVEVLAEDPMSLETVLSFAQFSYAVAPESFSDIRLSVIPRAAGTLRITGIRAVVCGSMEQVFEISGDENVLRLAKIKSHGPNKSPGEHDLSTHFEHLKLADARTSDDARVASVTVVTKVVSPQPTLSLEDVSVQNGWAMLLEGERFNFGVLFRNSSQTPINHLTFAARDLTIEPLTEALGSKDLPANEIYEIEYYLIKKEGIRLRNQRQIKQTIAAGEEFVLDLELIGKRGMKEASVVLEYAFQDVGAFLTRSIAVPVLVSVYPSIELAGCDLVPIFVNAANDSDLWRYLSDREEEGERVSDYCLLVLDFRNAWGKAIDIELGNIPAAELVSGGLNGKLIEDKFDEQSRGKLVEDKPNGMRTSKGSSGRLSGDGLPGGMFLLSDTIPPRCTRRYILPVKRIKFSDEHLQQPIPSLRNKQFIVDKTSKEEARFIREAFWYRKQILSLLQGTWKEAESDRHGDIELRGIRLSQKMVNILKVQKAFLELTLSNAKRTGMNWDVVCEDFFTVKTKITNYNDCPIVGVLRHVPCSISDPAKSVDRKILYNGVLQHATLSIAPGQTVLFEMGVCVLDKGEYEWGVIFEELRGDRLVQYAQHEPMYIRAV